MATVEQINDLTNNAYSRYAYGDGWILCIEYLSQIYSSEIVVAILRSIYMEWAVGKSKNLSLENLKKFMNKYPKLFTHENFLDLI